MTHISFSKYYTVLLVSVVDKIVHMYMESDVNRFSCTYFGYKVIKVRIKIMLGC